MCNVPVSRKANEDRNQLGAWRYGDPKAETGTSFAKRRYTHDTEETLEHRPVPITIYVGAQWLSGRVLDSRPKGSGFEPHRRHCVVVLEQDAFILV